MTPQELKASILQLAVQGKLVEQRPEEGTGKELFRQIQAEKQQLIKAGKIKKEKPLPDIAEDEIPFDIPENWCWVRVAQIVTLNPKNDLDDNLDTAFIPMPCVSDGFRNTHTFEVKKWGSIKKGFTHFADGDIGVAKITPCFQNRKSVVFRSLINGYGAGTTELTIVRVINDTILRDYLLWFFKTEYFIANGVKSFTGTAGQQRIHKDYLATSLIPLPPLAEQRRIVAKIEELLPYIDRYEQAWSKLENFNKRFPVDMQKSILQMAIQGKLVEQRPEEGTGEELYRQIQAEKQVLVKAGKIKKEKPLPVIAEDEIPFDIPESWKWVRLNGITTKITDGTHHSPPNSEHGDFMYVTAKNIKDNGVMLSNITYVSKEVHSEIFARCNPEFGDVLLIKDGATTGVVTVNDIIEPFSILSSVALLKMPENMSAWYLVYVLRSDLFYKTVRAQMKGTGITRITLKQIEPLVIPLPPLAEQKRIVAKLEEILPLCERLK